MKHYTAEHPLTGNLPTADSFNREYDQHKGVFNGGIDRANLGQQAIGRAQFMDNAFHKVVLNTDIELPAGYQNSDRLGTSNNFVCLAYEDYTGGWKDVATYNLTGLHEGMLFVEFSCWAWVAPIGSLENPKATTWRFLYNGQIVAVGNGWYPSYANPYICAQFPISGSDGELTLQWKYSAPQSGYDTATYPQMIFAGGTILAIARWR